MTCIFCHLDDSTNKFKVSVSLGKEEEKMPKFTGYIIQSLNALDHDQFRVTLPRP